MKKEDIENQLVASIDALAEVEHKRWAHWQDYMHSKGIVLADGSLVLPADLVARWERQIRTPFDELSETEKESDRRQVQQFIPTVVEILSK